jgi:hypothetical protein
MTSLGAEKQNDWEDRMRRSLVKFGQKVIVEVEHEGERDREEDGAGSGSRGGSWSCLEK